MRKSKQPIINKEDLIDEVGDRNEDMEGYLRNWKSTENTKYAKPIISNPEGLSFIKADIPFTLFNTPIDYFKIPIERLIKDGFNVNKIEIPLIQNQYLNFERDFEKFKMSEKETVILNIQVGKGKTTIFYDLIKRYADSGNIVIVCSPFKKLVEKDFNELSLLCEESNFTVRNYLQISETVNENFTIEQFVKSNIHIMTINCLLQNPGNDRFEQSAIKRNYLKEIKAYAKKSKKKVIIFFDEIHESIPNFHSILLPSLYLWKDVVHKCFIASATFIESAVPVIKYISLLTERNIRVFEADRIRQSQQANLHLHITGGKYNAKLLRPLYMLKDIIEEYLPYSLQDVLDEGNLKKQRLKLDSILGKKVIILSGYKSLVKGLTDTSKYKPGDPKRTDQLVRKIKELFPRILTSDTDEIFDEKHNYLGTNFKTGINIKEEKSLYIILMPVLDSQKDRNSYYGIFSDGIPSIIQALARKRSLGDIHIITYLANEATILSDENLSEMLPPIFLNKMNMAKHFNQNDGLAELEKRYKWRKDKIAEHLESLQHDYPEYHYPSFDEFVIMHSQNLFVKNYESFGKGLTPYILKASLNNQFCNAQLKSITHYMSYHNNIFLKKEYITQNLSGFLNDKIKDDVKRMNMIEAFYHIRSFFKFSEKYYGEKNVLEEFIPNTFSINKRKYKFEEVCRLPAFNQAILNISEYARMSESVKISKWEYVRRRMIMSNRIKEADRSELDNLYMGLNTYIDDVCHFISRNAVMNDKKELLIHKDIYLSYDPMKLLEAYEIYLSLKQQDYFFSKYVFSYFNGFSETTALEKIFRSTFYELRNTGLHSYLPKTRRTFNNEKDAYLYLAKDSG